MSKNLMNYDISTTKLHCNCIIYIINHCVAFSCCGMNYKAGLEMQFSDRQCKFLIHKIIESQLFSLNNCKTEIFIHRLSIYERKSSN